MTTIYCSHTWNVPNARYLFQDCFNLKGAASYSTRPGYGHGIEMANPETGYFTWAEGPEAITLNENGSNSNMLKRYAGNEVNVKYGRALSPI